MYFRPIPFYSLNILSVFLRTGIYVVSFYVNHVGYWLTMRRIVRVVVKPNSNILQSLCTIRGTLDVEHVLYDVFRVFVTA